MEGKGKVLHQVRSVLILLSFILMLAVVVFQWLEISTYEIQDSMGERISNIFSSSSSETTSTETAEAAPDQAAGEDANSPNIVPNQEGSGESADNAGQNNAEAPADNSEGADEAGGNAGDA